MGYEEVSKYELFRAGAFTSWDALLTDVARFVTWVGRENLIAVSHSADKGEAVVVVWYWAAPG